MNLPRIFANAIARRVAYVVVALVLAAIASLFGMGEARAADMHPDRGDAYAHCMVQAQAYADLLTGMGLDGRPQCDKSPTLNRYKSTWCDNKTGGCGANYPPGDRDHDWPGPDCPTGGTWNEETKECEVPPDCASASPLGPGAWSGVNSDMQMCQEGCTFEGGIGGGVGVCLPVVIDGTTYQHCTSWGPTGEQCSSGVGNGSLAPPDSDGDGSSDGNDSSPNNPGSGGGGKDGKPGEDESSACGGPDQPPCESDGSNSGSGKGNTSGGGGNCQTPPSSTGDAILAQIAFQTWATRCAIEGNANGGVGGGSGNGEGDGDQPDWTKGDGPAPAEDDTDYVEEQRRFGLGISADMLDQENLFGSSSCPQISFTFWKVNVNTVNFPWWCQVVEWMGYAVMLIGAWTALNILLGRSPV